MSNKLGAPLAWVMLAAVSFTAFSMSPSHAQLSAALVEKSTTASLLAQTADRDGNVPVIIEFARPPSFASLQADGAAIENVKAEIAPVQNAIISTHFGSVSSPRPGNGFERRLQVYDVFPMFAARVSREELDALAADPRITRIHENYVGKLALDDSVPLLQMTGVRGGYAYGGTGGGWAVVVVDSGVQANHEFLTGKVIYEACFSNGPGGTGRVSLCGNGGVSQSGAGSANPEVANCVNGTANICAHGTHVAGIASGFNTNRAPSGEPANGVAKNAGIIAIQVMHRRNLDSECGGTGMAPCLRFWGSDLIAGLSHVAGAIGLGPNRADGYRVASVNISLGNGSPQSGYCDTDPLKTPLDSLLNQGVITIIAAGNEGSTNGVSAPGCISTAYTVASQTKGGGVSSFSNMGQQVDAIAPGGTQGGTNVDIRSSVVAQPHSTTTYDWYWGTSMAAPHIAGAIAAVRSACPNMSASSLIASFSINSTVFSDGRAGGTFSAKRPRVGDVIRAAGCTRDIASHDFDGQKMSDIAWRDNTGVTALWLMNRANVQSSAGLGTVPTNWSIVAQRDFNADGKHDFLWRDMTAGTMAMWFMNGTTVASVGSVGTVPSNWTVIGSGDFDRDGSADLLWRDTAGNTAVWLMNGSAVKSSGTLGVVPSDWSVAGIADFGKQPGQSLPRGEADILWYHTSGALSLWRMQGTTVPSTVNLGTVPTVWRVAGLGDFNGDGSVDILWRHTTTGELVVWIMLEDSVWTSVSLGTVSNAWTIAQIGDYDADGYSDILWRDGSGAVAMWLMTGTPVLPQASVTVKSSTVIATIPLTWTIQNTNANY